MLNRFNCYCDNKIKRTAKLPVRQKKLLPSLEITTEINTNRVPKVAIKFIDDVKQAKVHVLLHFVWKTIVIIKTFTRYYHLFNTFVSIIKYMKLTFLIKLKNFLNIGTVFNFFQGADMK